MLRITRLSPDEGARLRAIRLRALRADPDAFGSTLAETASRGPDAWRQQLEDLETYVAVVDGIDAGMVRGVASSEDPADAWLLSMWVAPDVRRRGVGRALIGAVVAWARGAGFTRLLLDVADDNEAAVATYAALGFVPTGQVGALSYPRAHVREHRRALDLRPTSRRSSRSPS